MSNEQEQTDTQRKRSEAAKKGAATRARNRLFQRGLHAQKIREMADRSAAQQEPQSKGRVNISVFEEREVAPGASDWSMSFTHEQIGATYEETYARIVIAQLKLQRAFEANNDDWWGKDTTITDAAIAIWEERLRRLTMVKASEEEINYHFARAVVSNALNGDFPQLAQHIRTLAEFCTPAEIVRWFISSEWVNRVSITGVIAFIDRIQD